MKLDQAIADGINALGWGPDVPNEQGEMKFSADCHEVQTIAETIVKHIQSIKWRSFETNIPVPDRPFLSERVHVVETAALLESQWMLDKSRKGMAVLNQALHESEGREDKLRTEIAGLKALLERINQFVDPGVYDSSDSAVKYIKKLEKENKRLQAITEKVEKAVYDKNH